VCHSYDVIMSLCLPLSDGAGGEMVIRRGIQTSWDPMLRASGLFPEGDVNDPATGFSPFPGNINQVHGRLG